MDYRVNYEYVLMRSGFFSNRLEYTPGSMFIEAGSYTEAQNIFIRNTKNQDGTTHYTIKNIELVEP